MSETLSPYQSLVRISNSISHQLSGLHGTVDYSDIGITHARKFFDVIAVETHGVRWLIGCVAPDHEKRNEYSYLFSTLFNWKNIFNRPNPKIYRNTLPQETFKEYFSPNHAVLSCIDGKLFAPHCELSHAFDPIVINEAIRIHEVANEYSTHLPKLLAPMLANALAQESNRTVPTIKKF
ncbi:MAG TPA: hypothetical protein VK158_05865 [Acidobacteriota bacterium]|nr:hypothetical protein [Acidobacteriota bacterium]